MRWVLLFNKENHAYTSPNPRSTTHLHNSDVMGDRIITRLRVDITCEQALVGNS